MSWDQNEIADIFKGKAEKDVYVIWNFLSIILCWIGSDLFSIVYADKDLRNAVSIWQLGLKDFPVLLQYGSSSWPLTRK